MRFLPLVALTLSLAGCDLVEVVPPDGPPVEPPPAQPVHPYGAGNGKVVFLSDLAAAQRIDVTLAGEPIGTVTKFVGCPNRVTTDDSLATAIRPAGTYQYSARSTTGLAWNATAVTVTEDEATRVVFVGKPSQYALHVPDTLEGTPVYIFGYTPIGLDYFQHTVGDSGTYRFVVQRPNVVQGDRVDIVVNDRVVTRGLLLGTTDTQISAPLVPGANYFAVRLSQDADGDGTTARVKLYEGETYRGDVDRPVQSRWNGRNVRYAC